MARNKKDWIKGLFKILDFQFSDYYFPSTIESTEKTEKAETEPSASLEDDDHSPLQVRLINISRQLLGTDYQGGGTSPERGFDCSGFIKYIFNTQQIFLPRTSQQQALIGQKIPTQEAKAGDLVFFSHTGRRINHVGIVTSNPGENLKMIHASSSKGVIETVVPDSEYWTSRIKFVKRISET